jgi:methylthioribose-1-phosphate isomerase
MKSGQDIPIEMRDSNELLRQGERVVAPEGMETYTPAFDVTPNDLVTAIITEHGVMNPPFEFRHAVGSRSPEGQKV